MIDACVSKWAGSTACSTMPADRRRSRHETVPVEGFDAAMATLVRSVMLGMKHAAPS